MVRPVSDRYSQVAPLANYKWKGTKAAIEGLMNFEPDPYEGFAVEYINPSYGQTANPTMGAWMQKLPKGFHAKHIAIPIPQSISTKVQAIRSLMECVLTLVKEIISSFRLAMSMLQKLILTYSR
jgi:hypothetical protein